MRKGLLDVLPKNALEDLTAEDFRLLVNGCGEVNVQMLISFTSFNDESGMFHLNPYTSAHRLSHHHVVLVVRGLTKTITVIFQGRMQTNCCSSNGGFGP